ncbi:helix-turn-helix domain-containing protein [Isoptericola sp. NPDC056618]|uniref:helix-turn-helix domain-containing protein n=1 Tax=Isoptericola sp. NPDC056618 TaxID=3345878 RepID=UPI00368F4BC5
MTFPFISADLQTSAEAVGASPRELQRAISRGDHRRALRRLAGVEARHPRGRPGRVGRVASHGLRSREPPTEMTSLMTTPESAAYLGVKESWLRDHPEVPRVKLGRLVRYRVSDLEAWLDTKRAGPPRSGVSSRSRRSSRSSR